MELLFCFLVAWFFVKDTAVDGWAMAKGQKPPRHTERLARRQQEHERRLAAMKHRSAERIGGVGGPTAREAVAERIRRGPKSRDQMHGPRAWWFDLSADTAERLTRERREREARRAQGEQEWQKFARSARDRYRRAGERAGQRWQERNAPRDPHRRWVDSERADEPAGTDWPDPNAHNPGTEDAQVVDDPQPQPRGRSTPERPELEPGWPEPESMPCPDCRGAGCRTCGQDGRIPAWLADPAINSAADSWATEPSPENPPGTVRAVAERIPKPLGASPAESTNNSTNDGGPMSETAASRAAAEAFSKNNPRGRLQAEAAAGLATVASIEAGARTAPLVPIQGGSGVALSEASADMTAANATAFAGTATQILRMTVQAYSEAVADLAANKKVSGPALAAFQAAESDLESALLNTQNGGRVTAEHAAAADEYRDYQAQSGSGDAKTYAELR